MKNYGTYAYNENWAERIRTELEGSYSDKASFHKYHLIYAHVLENVTVSNFLEIGLFLNELQHTDLTAWANIFPEANIYGADRKREQLFSDGRIQTSYVDQEDIGSFTALKEAFPVQFDVILDDASHEYLKTINTFENLFPTLAVGGVYLIEDIRKELAEGMEWQQTIEQLETYCTDNSLTYEIFDSNEPALETSTEGQSEQTLSDNPDSYILCIYK